MKSGLHISAQADRTIGDLDRAAALLRSEVDWVLAWASIESGAELRVLMTQKQRRDSFWGVIGANPPGLGRRTGTTISKVVATGRVYAAPDGVRYSFVDHPDRHVEQLEEGGIVPGNPRHRIPTRFAQTAAGADRYAGVPDDRIPGAFEWPTKKMINFKKRRPKNQWLVRGTKKGLEFLYVFKHSVKLKAHRTVGTMRTRMVPRIIERFERSGIRVSQVS